MTHMRQTLAYIAASASVQDLTPTGVTNSNWSALYVK